MLKLAAGACACAIVFACFLIGSILAGAFTLAGIGGALFALDGWWIGNLWIAFGATCGGLLAFAYLIDSLNYRGDKLLRTIREW